MIGDASKRTFRSSCYRTTIRDSQAAIDVVWRGIIQLRQVALHIVEPKFSCGQDGAPQSISPVFLRCSKLPSCEMAAKSLMIPAQKVCRMASEAPSTRGAAVVRRKSSDDLVCEDQRFRKPTLTNEYFNLGERRLVMSQCCGTTGDKPFLYCFNPTSGEECSRGVPDDCRCLIEGPLLDGQVECFFPALRSPCVGDNLGDDFTG